MAPLGHPQPPVAVVVMLLMILLLLLRDILLYQQVLQPNVRELQQMEWSGTTPQMVNMKFISLALHHGKLLQRNQRAHIQLTI
jgi:hypothetical protein